MSIVTGASNTEALILLRVVPGLGTAIQHDTTTTVPVQAQRRMFSLKFLLSMETASV